MRAVRVASAYRLIGEHEVVANALIQRGNRLHQQLLSRPTQNWDGYCTSAPEGPGGPRRASFSSVQPLGFDSVFGCVRPADRLTRVMTTCDGGSNAVD